MGKRVGKRGITADQIESLLGQIRLPESGPQSMDEFIAALTRPSINVMRKRREVAIADLPVASEPIDWYRLGRRPIAGAPKVSRFLSFAAGDYYVQDAGSLLALAAAGADTDQLQGRLVCDLCSSPGGKATALVEAVGESGFVLANEVIDSRIGPLQLNLARTGSDRYAVSNLDPERIADRLGGIFDLVLVDAPCSGQAMLSRGKQSSASLTAKQISHSQIRQHRILDAAIRLVRDGGQLIYSTCTFAEAENESQVRRLVESGVVVRNPVAALAAYESEAACYRLWPHRHDCAGAFAASLVVNDQQPAASVHEGESDRSKSAFTLADQFLSEWFANWRDGLRLHASDSVLFGWPENSPRWVEGLAVAGPELAHRVGQTWRPSHAAALRRGAPAESIQTVDIRADQAKRFMRGETIETSGEGWQVVSLGGRPLGWIKASGSVGKNHLPKSARMQGELMTAETST